MTIHVRFEGKSYELEGEGLRLHAGSPDTEIRERLAGFLDVGTHRFVDYVIDRRPSGAIVVRPEAVYG